MVFPSYISKNLLFEHVHAFVKFVVVLHIDISQNIQEMHIAFVLISFDDPAFDHWHFLNTHMHKQILLPEDLHHEKTIKGN